MIKDVMVLSAPSEREERFALGVREKRRGVRRKAGGGDQESKRREGVVRIETLSKKKPGKE